MAALCIGSVGPSVLVWVHLSSSHSIHNTNHESLMPLKEERKAFRIGQGRQLTDLQRELTVWKGWSLVNILGFTGMTGQHLIGIVDTNNADIRYCWVGSITTGKKLHPAWSKGDYPPWRLDDRLRARIHVASRRYLISFVTPPLCAVEATKKTTWSKATKV